MNNIKGYHNILSIYQVFNEICINVGYLNEQ
jgi:hypothetical protein